MSRRGSSGIDRRRVASRQRDRRRSGRAPELAATLCFERILYKNRVLASRARRHQRRRASDQLLDPAHIFDRLGGQLGPRPRAGGRTLPALDGLVDRLDLRLGALACRKIVYFAALEAITGAHPDLLEAV